MRRRSEKTRTSLYEHVAVGKDRCGTVRHVIAGDRQARRRAPGVACIIIDAVVRRATEPNHRAVGPEHPWTDLTGTACQIGCGVWAGAPRSGRWIVDFG